LRKAQADLNHRNEVYFKFQTPNAEIRKELLSFIYRQKSEGDSTLAFVDPIGFEQFLTYEIPFRRLPPLMLKNYKQKSFSTDTWAEYPNYFELLNLYKQFEEEYPEICTTKVIGKTGLGRDLVAIKISDNVQTDENEPEILFTGSVHGNELSGFFVLLRLADYMLKSYFTESSINQLIDNAEVWFIPLVNPDGLYQHNSYTIDTLTRGNANGVDINRNFPDPVAGFHPDGRPRQIETLALMDFATAHHFVLSAALHTGAEVVNYPWDTWAKLHPETQWLRFISHEYADTAQLYSTPYYMNMFDDGTTNGYDWYRVTGGMQDYMNYFHKCREITLEISNYQENTAAYSNLYYDYNYRSLLNFARQSQYGFHGTITDNFNNDPLRVKIEIPEYDQEGTEVYSSATDGAFVRFLYVGNYTINLIAENDTVKVENCLINNYQRRNFNASFPSCGMYGIVKDKFTGKPIADAKVDTGYTPLFATQTDDIGNYTLSAPVGIYDIRISAAGYDTIFMKYIYFEENKYRCIDTVMVQTAISKTLMPKRVLSSNFPNPFMQTTTIVLPDVLTSEVSVYDSFGQDITHRLEVKVLSPKEISIDANQVPDGIYFVRTRNNPPFKIVKQNRR